MTPASHTLAYRVWGECNLHGWDRTIAEVAEALDEPVQRVRRIVQVKQWADRFRSGKCNQDHPRTEWAFNDE